MGETSEMSFKHLSWKTAMLVSLAAVTRVSEIQSLNTRDVAIPKESNKIVFFDQSDNDPFKTQDNSKAPEPLEIFAFEEDHLLCPVKCLNSYINRTKGLRGDVSQLFISSCKPHEAVTKSTIANWVKKYWQGVG